MDLTLPENSRTFLVFFFFFFTSLLRKTLTSSPSYRLLCHALQFAFKSIAYGFPKASFEACSFIIAELSSCFIATTSVELP